MLGPPLPVDIRGLQKGLSGKRVSLEAEALLDCPPETPNIDRNVLYILVFGDLKMFYSPSFSVNVSFVSDSN